MIFKYRLKCNIETVVPTCYLFLVISFYIFLKFWTQPLTLYPLLLLTFFTVFFLINILNSFVSKRIIISSNGNLFNYKVFFIFFVISFFYISFFWAGYFPGGFTFDSIYQYSQSVNNIYNDWHPVWHTFIFFKLPLFLSNNSVAFVVFFQIVYFSLSLGYVCSVIYKYSSSKYIAVSFFLYFLLNPFSDSIVLFPWKDVGFSIVCLICFVMFVRCYYENDIFENNFLLLLLFCCLLVSASLFRHNGVLFTAPLVLLLLMFVKRITFFKMVTLSAFLFITIKFVLYAYLNVEAPGSRVSETVGLPLTVITNVTKNEPDLIDSDIKDFMYSVSSKEKIEQYYSSGDFNSLKWQGINTDFIEKKGRLELIKYTIRCFEISPFYAFDAFIRLTDTVYGFHSDRLEPYISENSYGIKICEPNIFTKIVSVVAYIQNKAVFLWNRGVLLFAVILLAFVNFDFKSSLCWKKLALCTPLFVYDFGTMLLLTGPDNRFFYITHLVAPFLLFVLFYKKETTSE